MGVNKYAFVDLHKCVLCITENANHRTHFPDIRLHICMWCLVEHMLFYNIGYAQTLANLLTIHGSNSEQDMSNHWN